MRLHRDWADVAHQLRSGARSYRPRSLGNCLQIFTWVLVESNLDYARALDFVELQVIDGLAEDFWLNVTPLPDAITCDLVEIGVSRQPNGQCTIADRCRKETAHCHLPNFAGSQRAKLQKFADYLTTHAQVLKDQARIERLLSTVLEDSQAILGQSTCWPIGGYCDCAAGTSRCPSMDTGCRFSTAGGGVGIAAIYT